MKIFIGYEEAHPEMYEVCKASIERFNSTHEIQPLIKKNLQNSGVYSRPFEGESTDFAFTRFLVPYLCNYTGYALFCDGDFLWRSDPQEITHFKQNKHDVHVVKHPNLITDQRVKMDGRVNRPYDKKYWSSLMYMNCSELRRLDPESVSHAPAGDLHGFLWTNKAVGSLPATFNMLINYYLLPDPKAVHFTDGGPWLEGYKDVPYSDEWRAVLAQVAN